MLFERNPERAADDYCYADFYHTSSSSNNNLLASRALSEGFQMFLKELDVISKNKHHDQLSCGRAVIQAYKTYKASLPKIDRVGEPGSQGEVVAIKPQGPLAKEMKPWAVKVMRLTSGYKSAWKRNADLKRIIGDHPKYSAIHQHGLGHAPDAR